MVFTVDFTGVAGIMAAEQEVMILGGVVMAFFLILLLIIRTANRNDVPRASQISGDLAHTRNGKGEPRITELTNIEDPVNKLRLDNAVLPDAAVEAQESTTTISIAEQSDGHDNGQDMSSSAVSLAESQEDFKIFRRAGSAVSNKKASLSKPILATEELRLIEQSMVSLKNLFRDGHITRDVYVDETRTLYGQAKSLAKISGDL
jgi:hypothetical protein